jgi:hypothetical protein
MFIHVVGYVKETEEKKRYVLISFTLPYPFLSSLSFPFLSFLSFPPFRSFPFPPVPFLFLEHFTWKVQSQDGELGKEKNGKMFLEKFRHRDGFGDGPCALIFTRILRVRNLRLKREREIQKCVHYPVSSEDRISSVQFRGFAFM